MKTLANGVRVFNATPHPIRFWEPEWVETWDFVSQEAAEAFVKDRLGGMEHELVLHDDGSATVVVQGEVVFPDEPINARPVEEVVSEEGGVTFVRTRFVGSEKGEAVARQALQDGADVVVGSIVAAQAYPGLVVGMTPAAGFERVPPAKKRMNPRKFVTFEVFPLNMQEKCGGRKCDECVVS